MQEGNAFNPACMSIQKRWGGVLMYRTPDLDPADVQTCSTYRHMSKCVFYEAHTVRKRAVGLRMKYLLIVDWFYCPPTELREGNVFSRVCLSVCLSVHWGLCSGSHLRRPRTHSNFDLTVQGTARQAAGTHPF